MKKLFSVLLAISLVLVFAACDNKGTVSDTNAPSDAFVKPENYSTVVTVTINPQFNLYLNDANEVLAVEPVNDDAKSVAKDITAKTGTLEAVMENIVTATNKGGFVKDTQSATVNIQVTEIKNATVDTAVILDKAKTSVDNSFKKLEIKAEVKTSVAEDAKAEAISSEQTSSAVTSSNTSEASSNAQTSKPAHTHSFAAANCTTPKKCSCGATEGKALGHSFKDGICSRCSAKDASYVPTAISKKNGEWTANYIDNDGLLYIVSFTLYGSADNLGFGYGVGDPLSSLPPEAQEDIRKHKDEEGYKDSYIVFEGKEFYCGRGSGDGIGSVTDNGTTVTVTDLEGAKLILTRTGENIMTVKESPATFSDLDKIPVGTKFTFKAN